MERAVDQLQCKQSAGAGPTLVRLPDVVVLTVAWSVGEAARAGRDRSGIIDVGDRITSGTGDANRAGIAGRDDRQPLIATQAELHRHTAARLDRIHDRRVADRGEEAGKGEVDRVEAAAAPGPAVLIRNRDSHREDADRGIGMGRAAAAAAADRAGLHSGAVPVVDRSS